MMKKIYVIIIGATVLFTAGWVFSQDRGDSRQTNGEFLSAEEVLSTDVVVKRVSSGYEPTEIVVQKNQRVVWINETQDLVWPASNVHPTHEIYSEFDPLTPIEPGQAWAFIFSDVGEWQYHDHLNPRLRGTITVQE